VPYEVEPIPLDLATVLPSRSTARDRARLVLSFLIGIALHALILWLVERNPLADIPPLEETIPVEVIIEPPPPEPEPDKQPEPEPEVQKPPQEFFEKPATDTPRSSDTGGTGQQSEPKPVTPEPPQQPAPERAQEPQKADPWGLQTQLPELKFEAPAPKSKLPRGQADNTYLSNVYGHIMENLRLPNRDLKVGRAVQVDFGIDSAGRVFQPAIVASSGDRDIDAAAMNAVRNASPLPPPPAGGPIFLNFKFQAR
jgi:protein TonB